MQQGTWPHPHSFLLAALATVTGMFSMSRMAVLTIDLGPSFLLHFLLLSGVFGAALLAFPLALGQYTGSGIIDVWRISPIFQVG